MYVKGRYHLHKNVPLQKTKNLYYMKKYFFYERIILSYHRQIEK